MKKKALVISNMYPGRISQTFGIFVKNQVEALRKKGMDIDVAVVKDPRMGKKYVLRKYGKWMLQILVKLLFKGRQYKLVHAHYVFPSGFFGLLFKKMFGAKLVITAHGGDIDKMPKKSPVIYKQTKRILQQADHIIAVGEALKDEMVHEFGVDETKISLMSMGVNRNVFAPVDQTQARETLGLTADQKMLLFAGNIIEAKGLLELTKAFQRLKQDDETLQLHFVGHPKEEGFFEKLQNYVKSEAIQNVHFHPAKPQKEVALWMSAADVFVLPSYIEGFGLVAVEAMSCQTPVVGSDVGGLSYLLKNEAGVLVQPKNVDSLTEGVKKVLYNDEIREQLLINGEQKAKLNDEDHLTDRLHEIYEQIGAN
ncbi:glycosyltransferase [Halobacillus salinarum]|uniref:Glycosyltransferase n=1 Tax=Halobacillus salinarum TaxID=2932257 RepID=A0ABY4EP36_9BACI|nr:glycosyltransferase [Halobacillus salinarum]UOQ45702.1 glycosyltransferase [Halobacillus salinarum]